jgi:hypothetical protein
VVRLRRPPGGHAGGVVPFPVGRPRSHARTVPLLHGTADSMRRGNGCQGEPARPGAICAGGVPPCWAAHGIAGTSGDWPATPWRAGATVCPTPSQHGRTAIPSDEAPIGCWVHASTHTPLNASLRKSSSLLRHATIQGNRSCRINTIGRAPSLASSDAWRIHPLTVL